MEGFRRDRCSVRARNFWSKSVRTQTTLLGSAEQQASDLAPLQSLFDLTSATGVSGSLNSFFNSFSSLSVSPNDTETRQNVITQAQATGDSVQSGRNRHQHRFEQRGAGNGRLGRDDQSDCRGSGQY